MTRIIEAHPQAPLYSRDAFMASLEGVEERPSSKGDELARGLGYLGELTALEYLNQIALDRIKDWAPVAFPGGELHGTGAWRRRRAGESVEEDLSIAPNGIRDFGQQWDEPVGTRRSAYFKLTSILLHLASWSRLVSIKMTSRQVLCLRTPRAIGSLLNSTSLGMSYVRSMSK